MSADRQTGLKLHLGCGSNVASGWENLDKSPGVLLARMPHVRKTLRAVGVLTADQDEAVFPEGIRRVDVRHGLPYKDATVDSVYSSHMIEHMPRWQGLRLTKEINRVLRPGGVVRFATPDLKVFVASYEQGERRDQATAADAFMTILATYAERPGNRVASLSQRLFTAPHQWLYNAESLTLLLSEAGLTDVSARGYLDSAIPDLQALELRADSLFVEGRKPQP